MRNVKSSTLSSGKLISTNRHYFGGEGKKNSSMRLYVLLSNAEKAKGSIF